MKWSIMLTTTLTAFATAACMSSPASAGLCKSHRTIDVAWAYKGHVAIPLCKNKLLAKGKSAFGANFGSLQDFKVECQIMGDPDPDDGMHYKGGQFVQCICSAYLCKKSPIKVKPSDDPDLDRKPKKLDPNPGVPRIPHGSLGTRRASPPSFSVPRMGPPKIR